MATTPPSSQISVYSFNEDISIRESGRRETNEGALGDKTRASEAGEVVPSKITSGKKKAKKGLRRKSSERAAGRAQNNSLRRVKDSTDALRDRSLQVQQAKKDITSDGGPAGREGRQFTVENVGKNGMIYLRSVHIFYLTSYCAIKRIAFR